MLSTRINLRRCPEGLARLGLRRPLSMISRPSATNDIELNRRSGACASGIGLSGSGSQPYCGVLASSPFSFIRRCRHCYRGDRGSK